MINFMRNLVVVKDKEWFGESKGLKYTSLC